MKSTLVGNAEYYSGGFLKGAEASWFIETRNYYFTPASKFNQYSFMDWDRDIYWSADTRSDNDIINQSDGVTDKTGHLDISQTFDLGESKVSKQISLYANVTDVGGNTVSGSAGVIVHQSEYYAGIRSERYIGTHGESYSLSA